MDRHKIHRDGDVEVSGSLQQQTPPNVIMWMNDSFIFLKTKCLVSTQNERRALQRLMNMSFFHCEALSGFGFWRLHSGPESQSPINTWTPLPTKSSKDKENNQWPCSFRLCKCVPLQRRKETPLEHCVCNYFAWKKNRAADEAMSWRKVWCVHSTIPCSLWNGEAFC